MVSGIGNIQVGFALSGRNVKLNVGCGRTTLPGYLNVDLFGGEVHCSITSLPFREGAFTEINASEVLEHVVDLSRAMRELHRVLAPGGEIHADVPYGLQGLYNPHHHHAFDRSTFLYFCKPMKGPAPPCLQIEQGLLLVRQRTKVAHVPLQWHLWAYAPGLAIRLRPLWERLNEALQFPLFPRALFVVIRKEGTTPIHPPRASP